MIGVLLLISVGLEVHVDETRSWDSNRKVVVSGAWRPASTEH